MSKFYNTKLHIKLTYFIRFVICHYFFTAFLTIFVVFEWAFFILHRLWQSEGRIMLENILPSKIYKIINEKINFNSINEIRLRADKPILLSIGKERIFLGENGRTGIAQNAIKLTKVEIEDIIFRASECSLYSVNEQIKKGFIITPGGVRLGIGGDMIEEGGTIRTMTNYSSINIRIPHEIKNCSLGVFEHLLSDNGVYNSLIVSPPGAGKTTFLRDFICQLSERNYALNVLVLDERGELDIGGRGLGNFTDKISFARKKIGFENGIRSLAPDLIVTDELGQEEDMQALNFAVNSGVNILASVHCDSMASLTKKPQFEKVIQDKIFKRYVFLSLRNGPGTIEGVYNENLSRISL